MTETQDHVLVTGAGGQLGTAMCAVLAGRYEVVAAAHGACDIADLQAVLRLAEERVPGAIVNCAAYTDVDGCEDDPDRAFRVNALGARNVAIAARAVGAKLVHVSTDYVFDGEKKAPYVEWDAAAPLSVYGRSKLLGEAYVREQHPRHFIVRTAWLYGAGGRNFVTTMLRLVEERDHLRIVADTSGTPTCTEDLARSIAALLDTDCYGTYHCTSQGTCSWYTFAVRIFACAGYRIEDSSDRGTTLLDEGRGRKVFVEPVPSTAYAQRAVRPANAVLDNYLLRVQGLDRMPNWEAALRAHLPRILEEGKEGDR